MTSVPFPETAEPFADFAGEIKKLGAQFEAAWKHERNVTGDDAKTDEESDAAIDVTRKLVNKILAAPASGLFMMQLKARAWLWCESKTVEELDGDAEVTSDRVLVSLFRDLGADRPVI